MIVAGFSLLRCGPIGEEGTASGGSGPNGGASTTGGSGGSNGGGSGDSGSSGAPWDWVGIVGTGQSLSTGTPPLTSTTQPYNNLKLSLGGVTVPPWDASNDAFEMVPLVEPIRTLANGYPSPYPKNLYGESPHSALANELTRLVGEDPGGDYVTVHTAVGESGQGIIALKKQTGDTTGMTGRAYAATIFEAEAIARLARQNGKTYGIGAIVMTHGETDSGSVSYDDALVQLLADYNADLSAITGQTQKIPMYLSQQHAFPNGANSAGFTPIATISQWKLGVDRPGDFVCTGPKYQYPGDDDGIHLTAVGYQMLGEKVAEVHYERAVLGRDWQPLQPLAVERNGRTVTVRFHVPVPPLVWDETFDAPALEEWREGRGFELRTSGERLEIASVDIVGDTVEITAATDLPATGLYVGYALSSQATQMSTASRAVRWGKLRDSDPFVGSTTNLLNPNYGVMFELLVP